MQFHGVVLDIDKLWIVSEYMSMGSLDKLIKSKSIQLTSSENQIDDKLARAIMRDIAKALHYLHTLQPMMIHRDIKPANIFMMSLHPKSNCCCKLGDFGTVYDMS